MRFVSDPVKERKNIGKHGLDFSAAKEVFDDPLAATIYDRNQDGEDRYWQVGMTNFGLLEQYGLKSNRAAIRLSHEIARLNMTRA
jgi:uncharacterized DUF497 family protein